MKQQADFLDKNTLMAVLLVFISWFAWDSYMRKKYPTKDKAPVVTEQSSAEKTKPIAAASSSTLEASKAESSPTKELKKEELFSFESPLLSFSLSSRGMGFKKLVLNQIFDRAGREIWLFSGEELLPFQTSFIGQGRETLDFKIKKTSDHSWEGVAEWHDVKIKKTVSVEKNTQFLLKTKISLEGRLRSISGISTLLTQTQKGLEKQGGFLSLFTPPDISAFFISSSKGFEQVPLLSEEEAEELTGLSPLSKVKAAAIGTKYFGQAWMEDKSDVLPNFQITAQNQRYQGRIEHRILNPNKTFEISYKMFIGPKDFTLLKKEHPSLIEWMDFGWFGSLSRLTLKILAAFYSVAGNWGISIILLTILVRFLLLPCVLYSHRSMEVMKRVQPEIQEIRKKFKKDPQRMNQEVMALMRNNKANPLGGFLPLLLQIPIFWALWRALSNSYSLYQAPFFFWIQDLSWKDPYYVLPISMGLLMFVHQKISSVTMNKDMARVMQIMPVLMTLFMINFPSGLMLYMLISTAFGLVQQIFLNKRGEATGASPIEKKDNKNV